MKHHLLLLIFIITSNFGFSQIPKYFNVDFVPESSPGACDAQIHIKDGLMVKPYYLFYYSGYRVGNESHIMELCSNTSIRIDITDSSCITGMYIIYIAADPDSQILADTIVATVPTSAGATDGTLKIGLNHHFPFTKNYLVNWNMGTTINSFDTSYTGLNEGLYSFEVWDTLHSIQLFSIDINLFFSPPFICDHNFDFNINIYPASPGLCNGVIQCVPTVGDTADYQYMMTGYSDGYPNVNCDGFGCYSMAYNVCPQPVGINIYQLAGSNYYSFSNRIYFVGIDTSGTFIWVPPVGTIPSTTDTILIPSIYNCMYNYSIPPDTVYTDTIISYGSDYYEYYINVVQDTNVFSVIGEYFGDTSLPFFFDFSFYCPDSVVLKSPSTDYKSMRGLLFSGNMDNTTYVHEQADENKIKVYPNPVDNLLFFDSRQLINKVVVESITGQSIDMQILSSNCLNVNFLPDGIYIAKFYSRNNLIYKTKFVKQ